MQRRKEGEKKKTARKGKELGIRYLAGCFDLQKREEGERYSLPSLMMFDI
ncbi:hypothetical protein HanPSC8_Chr07g0297991 [Helianthus annuus]|nr:hypothetical protein HanPSC8_Chr07g0297991 [Helianthus annuus]